MQTTVTFKQIDPSSSLKDYVQKKLEKFDKMLESPADAHVVLSVEKIRHMAEITLTCDKVKIHAKEESDNMYSSIDALMDKIRIQIKKNKEKIKRHMSGKKQSIKDETLSSDSKSQDHETSLPEPQIVLETIDYKPMDIEDAIIELNTGAQPFFVFNNARTERVNVLYKQNNGKLGLIQPKG